ncbi:MAG: hypothetical protein OEW42_06795 [Acidimicrobiia bacterium]|nr:hypothetical protein [Acidimicrobiia bacterium]MDH5238404.1 hypothetical protein [Acidimicrobiia bacterium]
MNPTTIIVLVGAVLAAALTGLWSVQQYHRGRRTRARTVLAVTVLLSLTGTVVADAADLDETTRLIDLGPVTPPPMWQVRSGDHFWFIARATLASRGVQPTVEEIDPYWRALIAFNQSHRAEPLDPDVLHVGELIWLPDPDGPNQPD